MQQCSCGTGNTHGHHRIKIAVGLALVFFLVASGFLNLRKFRLLDQAPHQPYTITVSGTAKITAAPNIATTNIGLVTDKTDPGVAQSENAEKMNKLIAALKTLGIAGDDLKTTQYQGYPKYSYDAKAGSTITGYTISQNVEVKIRDLQKISAVLSAAAAAGSNQIGGIEFTIDDPKKLESEARAAAINDAKEKAAVLARQLRVELAGVVNFSETTGNPSHSPYAAMTKENAGAAPDIAPNIQAGTLDIRSDVFITFEIED